METIKGKIQKKEDSEGVKKDGSSWRRAAFTINDKKYSTFDDNIIKSFKVGDYIVMTGQQEGKYWNMKTMGINENGNEPEGVVTDQTITDLLRQILAELKEINSRAK